MNVVIKHPLTEKRALSRVKKALGEARKRSKGHIAGLEERWEGRTVYFSFSIQGKKIDGSLEVRDGELEINAKLPLLFRVFEGQVKRAITEEVQGYIRD